MSAPARRLDAFLRVARRDDLHVGQRAGDRDVLLGVVRAAERGVDDAGAHADHRDGEVLVAQVVAHHLEGAVERERRDGVGEGLQAFQRQAGADADHALLGDADVDEAVGELGRRTSPCCRPARCRRRRCRRWRSCRPLRRASLRTCCATVLLQFLHGLGELVLVGRAVVPHGNVLHVADALALHGAGDHHQRLVARARLHGVADGGRIVAVDLDALPAEGAELFDQRIEMRVQIDDGADRDHLVVVDEGDDVAELERGRHQGGFPGGAFLHLAVGEHAVDDAVAALDAVGERHAHDHRQPVPERAGGGLDAGVAVVGVHAELAARGGVVVEILFLEDAEALQHRVLDHAAVPLRQNEGVGRIDARAARASARCRWRRPAQRKRRRRRYAEPAPAATPRGCAGGTPCSAPAAVSTSRTARFPCM